MLVARGGELLLRSAYGFADVAQRRPMTVEQLLPIGSITKSFTAGAILTLVRDGKLALDADVRSYLPDAPVGEHTVTIEQLLTHTSGMPNLVDVAGFEEWAERPRDTAQLLERTRDVPFHFAPGAGFRYSDSGYMLLGAVLERLHGGSWSSAVRDLVTSPLGLESVAPAGSWAPAAVGYLQQDSGFRVAEGFDWSVPHAAGALVADADDLLAWVLAWRDGRVAGRSLDALAWSSRRLPDGRISGYGFGWKRCDFEGFASIQHGGWVPGFTASILHLPEPDLTAVVLLNLEGAPDATYLARRALRLLLTGASEARDYPLTARERDALIGTYRSESGRLWRITAFEGLLQLDLGGSTVPLAAVSASRLCAADSDGTWCFDFEPGPDGRAAAVAASLSCEPQGRAVRE